MAKMRRNIGATISLNGKGFFKEVERVKKSVRGVKGAFDEAAGNFKGLGKSIGDLADSGLVRAGKAVAGFAAAIGGAALAGAVKTLKDSIELTSEFNAQMAKVDSIASLGADFDAVRNKAIEMGKTTKYTALESAQALEYMGMAGWDAQKMLDGLPSVMNLAAASGEDLATVSDIVTDAMTAFGATLDGGINAANIEMFSDVLAQTSRKSNTNVSMLGESFKNVASVAGAMGYGIKDTALALGLMANNGVKGGEAGTALRAVMTRFAKPTKEVMQAMNKLGLQAVRADGSMRTLSELIPDIQKKFAGLSESEAGAMATMIAGKNAMSGFLAIANSAPEDIAALDEALKNSAGVADWMRKRQEDTFEGQKTLLKSQIEVLKMQIGESFGEDALKGFVSDIKDLVTFISDDAVSGFKILGNGVKKVFTTIKKAAMSVRPEYEELKEAIGRMMKRRGVLSGISSDAESFGAVIAMTFGAVLRVLTYAADHFEEIRGTVKAALAAFIAFKGIAATVSTVTAVTKVINGLRGAIAATTAIKGLSWVGTVAGGLQSAAIAAGTFAASFAATKKIMETIDPSNAAAYDEFAADPFGNIREGLMYLTNDIAELSENIGIWAAQTWDSIKKGFFGTVSEIKTSFSGAWDFIKSKWDTFWYGVVGTVSEIKSSFSEMWKGIKNSAAAAFNFIAKKWNSSVGSLAWTIPEWVPGVGGNTFAMPKIAEIPMMAEGGTVRRSGAAIVGERGAEMLDLPRGAQVTPLGHGGGKVFNINITVNGGAGDDADRIAAVIAKRVKAEIAAMA